MTTPRENELIFPTSDAELGDITDDEDFELRISDTSDDDDNVTEYDVNKNVLSQSELSKDLNRLIYVSNRELGQDIIVTSQYCSCSTNDTIHNRLYKILHRLLNAKVVIQKLPESVIQQYCSDSNKTVKKCNNKDVQGGEKYWRYCLLCDQRTEGSSLKQCQNCQRNISYDCKKCNKRLTTFSGIICHLRTICDFQGYNYCTECDYKHAMKAKINFHMKNKHPNVHIRNIKRQRKIR
ncbi:uncharacterized protein LOC131665612 isoform X2 [Phymastichus coffea]|uniref:uncharacterized protein LOC131665612 isoform X2 n=1 Tax=Phymastichus coffea TaxID=108790 RepID=UPI00273B0B29|nr:uncharacterized protein LOC131665612 isoform X2 [Phymastichus coffea]